MQSKQSLTPNAQSIKCVGTLISVGIKAPAESSEADRVWLLY